MISWHGEGLVAPSEYFMKNNGMKIKHPKLRGEWAEMCFMTRAAEHGLCVTRPWGEMSRYDFAVEYKGAVCAGAGEVHDVSGSRRVRGDGARVEGEVYG